MVIEEKTYLNHNVKLIHTNYGWTAQVQTDYGWCELNNYYETKTKCRKALWYYIINN